jgi:hypothetical protein
VVAFIAWYLIAERDRPVVAAEAADRSPVTTIGEDGQSPGFPPVAEVYAGCCSSSVEVDAWARVAWTTMGTGSHRNVCVALALEPS